jgi:Cdc6-like AAA superfamily ATPase
MARNKDRDHTRGREEMAPNWNPTRAYSEADLKSVEEPLPQFRFLASEMSLASSGRMGSGRVQALQILREAFTPTQPKQSVRLFAGRRRELKRIVSAIEEWKAHVVIFGERGYGKSSLANIVSEIARQGGITVLSCSCSSEITFEEMFRNFLRDIPLPYRGVQGRGESVKSTAARAGGNFASLLPPGNFGATELAEALRHLTDRHVIFRIDEFDRVRDENVKNQLAEAIKNLSDVGARITFLIVGVADDLDDLLGRHPSIQRNVVGIHLSLMNDEELGHLITAGEVAAGVAFDADVKARIVALAQGNPYQAQLICLHAGQAAIEEGAKIVRMEHLMRAGEMAAAMAPRGVERVCEMAFAGPQHDRLKAIAVAAARCRADQYGTFTAADVCSELARTGKEVPREDAVQAVLARFATLGPDRLLKIRDGGTGQLYAFLDQVLKVYVSLQAL